MLRKTEVLKTISCYIPCVVMYKDPTPDPPQGEPDGSGSTGEDGAGEEGPGGK